MKTSSVQGPPRRSFDSGAPAEEVLRCGYATYSALETIEWKAAFETCRSFADRFEQWNYLWVDQDWKWPANPLQQWSRLWEYPFALLALRTLPPGATVLDAGSGLTFFPFLLASMGYRVTMMDTDVTLGRKVQSVKAATGLKVDYVNGSLCEVPLAARFDGICCISVLEHLSEPLRAVDELARLLADRTTLALTFDVIRSAKGYSEAEKLVAALRKHVKPRGGVRLDLPDDAITVYHARRRGTGKMFFDDSLATRLRLWLRRIPDIAVFGFISEPN